MRLLTEAEFERDLGTYDAVVRASRGVDRFCSSSEWALAAHAAWSRGKPTWIAKGEEGYGVLVRHGDLLLGFDVAWGFSCPLVGADPAALSEAFAAAVAEAPWEALLLPGIRPGSALSRAVITTFGRDHEMRRGPPLRRWVASLEGGVLGFLSRRDRKLRSNLRRAARRARSESVTFEPGDAHDGAATVRRAVEVERRSWKGPACTGLLVPDMRVFYDGLCERLAAGGRLRALFARRGGEDVGYILGGVRDGLYRGFQFSFDERLQHVSLGSLLQLEQIAALAAEGVETYDMGIDLPYKRWWADGPVDTVTLAVIRV